MNTLTEAIRGAQAKKVAIGHFNISNVEMLWGIFNAARSIKASDGSPIPVIIGVSEGERAFIGVRQSAALIKSLRDEFNYPIYLNADHSYSFDKVKEAIDAGFDAAIFDGAKLSLEENIKIAKQCVDYAAEVAKTTGRKVLIESELGYIGQSSKILDAIPEGVKMDPASLTSPEQAVAFVSATGVDLFAPAVGNIHGMLRVGHDPRLDITRIGEIAKAVPQAPLVLHGGSGTVDEDFTMAIAAGIAIVHISTELRVAYQKALKLTLEQNPDEVAPYKYLKPTVQAVQDVAAARLRLFNNLA